MQDESLARELSAYFCGIRADMENPEVAFALSKILPKTLSKTGGRWPAFWNLVLEIRIREADIAGFFAFVIGRNGFVSSRGSAAAVKDSNNKVLWHCFGRPICLLFRNKKGWFCSERAENHLYIFGLLPGCNCYEIYKVEVELAGKNGKLIWQRICRGRCFYSRDGVTAAEEKNYKEWPSLAGLFENSAFQDNFRPYIFRGQIPPKGPEAEEEKSEKSLPEALL